MKNILIFSNPFGYGPSGKALSIARYIDQHATKAKVYLCGGEYLRGLAGGNYEFIQADDRDEASILKAIGAVKGKKYIISSQNRFAIKVAKENNIPCAFLDGLAWFWKEIPKDHLFADIIFWINFPNIREKISLKHEKKIHIIGGITEETGRGSKNSRRNGTLIYIGGCNNPLTPIPGNYLNLIARMIQSAIKKNKSKDFYLATDQHSKDYLGGYPALLKKIKKYDHIQFITKVSRSKLFLSNGGQTATLESVSLKTPVSFFLSINLSQLALINMLSAPGSGLPSLRWENYIKMPKDIYNYTEKEAILFFDGRSKKILQDKKSFKSLCDDFSDLLFADRTFDRNNFLKEVGFTGVEDIYKILSEKWGIA